MKNSEPVMITGIRQVIERHENSLKALDKTHPLYEAQVSQLRAMISTSNRTLARWQRKLQS